MTLAQAKNRPTITQFYCALLPTVKIYTYSIRIGLAPAETQTQTHEDQGTHNAKLGKNTDSSKKYIDDILECILFDY